MDLLIFGPGFTGGYVGRALQALKWRVTGVNRGGGGGALAMSDVDAVRHAIATCSHILSTVPPEGEVDPVLTQYGGDIASSPARWTGYLSSTGVYGNAGGAWVDETAPLNPGRRTARADADRAWAALPRPVHIFRLPGIYGPGRSPLDRVRAGTAHRIEAPGHLFSRIHVEDILRAIMASFDGPPGAYNLADDRPCSQRQVIETACGLLGLPLPPLQHIDDAQLSPAARGFYAENRRIANGKAKRLLGWAPLYPDWKSGLASCL